METLRNVPEHMSCDVLRVMSFNVHSCIGRNGRTAPQDMAKFIAAFGPDIIALQELDIGMQRTLQVDQAAEIAAAINMDFHFHPSFQMEEGKFGNAILSRFPMKLIKADALPTLDNKSGLEKRGALWVQIECNMHTLQVLNTHLGLNRRERLLQIDALLGTTWLGDPACRPPVIYCADLNALPQSKVYRRLRRALIDTHEGSDGRWTYKTWPSRFPIIRIDYIFVSPDIRTRKIITPHSRQARTVSDHLPVIVDIEMTPGGSINEENP